MKEKKEENGVKREMTNDKRTTKVTTRNENKKMAERKTLEQRFENTPPNPLQIRMGLRQDCVWKHWDG